MAGLLRSAMKLSCNFSRLSHLHRVAVRPRIAQQSCSIFTSNKKKDSAAIAVAEKEEVKALKPEAVEDVDPVWLVWLVQMFCCIHGRPQAGARECTCTPVDCK